MALLPDTEPRGRCRRNCSYNVCNNFQGVWTHRTGFRTVLGKMDALSRISHSTAHAISNWWSSWCMYSLLNQNMSLKLLQAANTLKCGLDTLLREWKPRNFNPMEVGIDPVRVCWFVDDHTSNSRCMTLASCLYRTRTQTFHDLCSSIYFWWRHQLLVCLVARVRWRFHPQF